MRIAERLHSRGVKIDFVSSLEQLSQRFKQKRSIVVILSDQGDDAYLESNFKKFISLPDATGARLILDQTIGRQDVADLAVWNGFRDIIPCSTIVDEWVDRFMFAASFGPNQTSEPKLQLNDQIPAGLELPARIVKLAPDTIRLETRLDPELGAIVQLQGELARNLGTKPISARVKKKDKQNLTHRFGQALELEPIFDLKAKLRYLANLSELRVLSTHAARRIFVVATNPNLRSKIIDRFQSMQQIVRTAVNKSSVFEDPRYFSPELVVIENKLCTEDNSEIFAKMLSILKKDCLCVIVGPMEISPIISQFPDLKFLQVPLETQDFGVLLSSLPEKKAEESTIDLPIQHPLTFGRLLIKVTISKLQPQSGEFYSNVAISNFALAWLDYPSDASELGRKPIIKILSLAKQAKKSQEKVDDQYQIQFYLSDATLSDRIPIPQSLPDQVKAEHDPQPESDEGFAKNEQNQPESPVPPKDSAQPRDLYGNTKNQKNDPLRKSVRKGGGGPDKILLWMAAAALFIILGGSFYWLVRVGSVQMDKLGEQYSKPLVKYKRQQELKRIDQENKKNTQNKTLDTPPNSTVNESQENAP